MELIGAFPDSGDPALERDPSERVSGDDPMTPAQKSYLDTLARQAGEQLPADLNKAEASQHIERLKSQLASGDDRTGTHREAALKLALPAEDRPERSWAQTGGFLTMILSLGCAFFEQAAQQPPNKLRAAG